MSKKSKQRRVEDREKTRPNSLASKRAKKRRESQVAAPEPRVARGPVKVSSMAAGRLGGSARRDADLGGSIVFSPPEYPPGVLPDGRTKIAMDSGSSGTPSQLQSVLGWAGGFGTGFHGRFAEGIGFMGYPYLAELTQRPEYRRAAEIIAEDMTRKWIRITASGDDEDGSNGEKIKALEAALSLHRIQDKLRQMVELDGFFGRCQLFIDVGDQDDRDEMTTPLLVRKKVAKGSLKRFTVVDPTWTAPNNYNSDNPLDPTYYRPRTWFVMAREIHETRLLTMIGRPVPDILKPAYNFGGLSLSQMMKPYVDNWLRTRQSVSDLLQAFTVFVLETNMQGILQGGSGEDEALRVQLFEQVRQNLGLMLVDADTEALTNVSAPVSTMDHLQAQTQEHMSLPSGIPLVKFFGITPSGLNPSAEGEIRVWYDSISARQQRLIAPILKIVLEVLQMDVFGAVDDGIGFEFISPMELDELSKATLRKQNADTDSVYLDQGIVLPDEVRERVAMEQDSMYPGLDLSQPAPGPPMMDQGGGEFGAGPEDGGGEEPEQGEVRREAAEAV